MITLALDTALQRCSVAILRDAEPLYVAIEDRDRGHAERIAPMVAGALAEAAVSAAELSRIGVVVGPGGFTGVRVALAFARAMGLATEAGVVGVTSLEALAFAGDESVGAIAPVIDARRGQVYAGLYHAGEALLAPFVATPVEARDQIGEALGGRDVSVMGSGAALVDPQGEWRRATGDAQIDPVVIARLAAAAPDPETMPAPLYLRAPDAKPSSR